MAHADYHARAQNSSSIASILGAQNCDTGQEAAGYGSVFEEPTIRCVYPPGAERSAPGVGMSKNKKPCSLRCQMLSRFKLTLFLATNIGKIGLR
jgi:hypothetical protein